MALRPAVLYLPAVLPAKGASIATIRLAGAQASIARVLAALIFCLAPQPSSAQQQAATDTVTAAVVADWPPYYLVQDDGRPTGFAVESFRAVADRAGLVPRFRVYPDFAGVRRAIRSGEVDVIPSMGVVQDRDYLFTTPIDAFHVSLFTRASTPGDVALEEIPGRIAVVETNIGQALAARIPSLDTVVYGDVREGLFRLLAGEVDGLLYPAPVVWALARQADVDHMIHETDPPLAEVKRAMAVAPTRSALRDRLDAAIRAFVGSPEYEALYRVWHTPPTPFWTARRTLWAAIILLVVLGTGAAAWRLVTLRRFNEALAGRERTFRALAAGLDECVMIVDPDDGTVRYVNPRSREVLRRPPEQVRGRPISRFLPEGTGLDGSEPRLVALTRPDGSTIDAEITVGPRLPDAEPPGLLLSIADVTERRAADARMAFQAGLLDLIGQTVVAADLDGTVTFWNRFAEKTYGWSRAEAQGRSIVELTAPPEARPQAEEILETVRSGERWEGELTVKGKDGGTFPAHLTTAPILDAGGRVIGIVAVAADLTGQKALEEQLRQSQKMEAIGRLAGGVAHDFNNLLTAIGGHIDLAVDRLEGDAAEIEAELAQAKAAADRAAALTRQLLAFSRRQSLHPVVLDVCETAAGLEPMLARLLGETVRVRVECETPVWRIQADKAQVEQTLLNLAVNARDAMPEGGELTIAVANRREAIEPEGERDWVEISVRDTGTGIPPHDLDRIFEPFFTTKEPGHGTGLGLAMVHGFVQQSGGHIEVTSREGGGTTFRILMPRTLAEPTAEPAPGADGVAETAGDRILLVEDHDAVRELARRILARAGYEIVTAADPREALEKLESIGAIDLLITDVVMPGMDGPQLAARITDARPGIRVLYTSGYSTEYLEEIDVDLRAGAELLPKPFNPGALLQKVREQLEA